jgi:hypothetical protein
MKLHVVRAIIILALVACSQVVFADIDGYQFECGGATPQFTQAEKVQKSEEGFQKSISTLGSARDSLQRRAVELRRQISSSRQENGHFDRDLTFAEQRMGDW